jgi:GAF domain-containing protein
MSKNSKKKQLNNHLETLFSDIEQANGLPSFLVESYAKGWIWDTDMEGILVDCSSNIRTILDFKKKDLVGKALSSFSTFDINEPVLQEAQANDVYPIQTEIVFETGSEKEITFNVQIFPRTDDTGDLIGWRGISIAMAIEEEPEEPKPEIALIPHLDKLLDLGEIPLPDTGALKAAEIEIESAPVETDITDVHEEEFETADIRLPEAPPSTGTVEEVYEKTEVAEIEESAETELFDDMIEGIKTEPDSIDEMVTKPLEMEDEIVERVEEGIIVEEPPTKETSPPIPDMIEGEGRFQTPAKTAPLYLSEEDYTQLFDRKTLGDIPHLIASEIVTKELIEDTKQEAADEDLTKEERDTDVPDTAPLLLSFEEENALLEMIIDEEGISGLLEIIDQDPDREWNDDELFLVEQVSSQLSLALENANLFQQTQQALTETDEHARRLRLLNEMSEELGLADHLEEVYEQAIEKTQQILNADRVSLAMTTPNKEAVRIVASLGEEGSLTKGTILPLEGTINKTAIDENRVIISSELEQRNLGQIQSFILGPVNISGEVIGTLNVGSYIPEAFSKNDENFMAQLLSLLGSIIENRRLFDAIEEALATTEEQARRLSQLNQLSERLGRANTFEEVLSVALEDVNTIIPADHCDAAIFDNSKERFQVYEYKDGEGVYPINSDFPLENTLFGEVTKANRLNSVNNLLESSFIDTKALADRGLRSTIVAPLSAGGNIIGTINVSKREAHAYTSQDENLMQSISSLVASTIDNRQLLGQIQHRSAQLETSAEVSRIASTILDINELLPRVVDLIEEGFGLNYAGLFLVDEAGEWTGEPNKWVVLQAGTGEAGQQMLDDGHKLEIGGDSMIGTAVATKEARIALDVGGEARFFRNPYLPKTRSEMALPLVSRGKVLGALTIQSDKESAFSQEDVTSLQTMAEQLANAIENAWLLEQTEARAEELTVLNEMARTFTQTLEVDTIIENIYQYTTRLINAQIFQLALYYPDEDEIEYVITVEDNKRVDLKQPRRKAGKGLFEWIIHNKQPLLIREDVERTLADLEIESVEQIPESWLGVPMLRGNEPIGVIVVQNFTTPRVFGHHDLDLLSAVASQAAVTINNARLFNQEQMRAKQEHLVRTITDKVRRGIDTQSIMKIALEELSRVLGADISTIRLGTRDQFLSESPPSNSTTGEINKEYDPGEESEPWHTS